MLFQKIVFVLISIVVFASCEKDDSKAPSNFSVAGYVQKGQLIKGSSITAYALNDNLNATGESFPSTIKDDLGSFGISAEAAAPYLELKAEGYYFVENTGETSEAPIYLNALVSSLQKDVNINLLTTVTSPRIKKLINDGKPFEIAKEQAEREILKAFSIPSQDMEVGFEEMNISEDGTANAILLAASCLIQEGRNAGEIQNIISDISSEFEATGTLSDKLVEEIFDKSQSVSILSVVRNLITFYDKKGVEDFEIPPFYTILNNEYSSGFHIIGPEDFLVGGMYDTDIAGGCKELHAISYEDFVTESDVEWITAESTELCPNLHALKINIDPNPNVSGRTGHLYVKSSNGDVLYTNKTTQRGNGQRIYMEIPYNSTKSFAEGDKINVNGKDYSLSFDPYVEKYYVDLPKSAGGYGISNMPNFVVAGTNGDVLCATFTYKPDIQEFIPDNDASVDTRSTGESISFNTTVEEAQAEKNPCYVALKGTRSFELPNPAEAKLQTACSLISLLFKYESSSDTPKFSKLKVELSDDGFLSGEVTTCMYPDQSMYDPTYIVPETVYKNKSNILNINNTNNDNKVSFLAHPQYIRTIKCTAYDSEDKEVFKVETTLNQELKKGTNITYTFSIPR